MADDYTIHTIDEFSVEERFRLEALTAASRVLQGYEPAPGQKLADACLAVAKKFESYLRGA